LLAQKAQNIEGEKENTPPATKTTKNKAALAFFCQDRFCGGECGD
jgi:hypothetical protein